MIKKILTVPNPLLRQKSQPVSNPPAGGDKKIKNLVKNLIDTIKATQDPKGVGLSAVQIGELVRIFAIKQGGRFVTFINPKITWQSKKMFKESLMEGCLSVPSFYGLVQRHQAIKLSWQDLEGNWHKKKFIDKESVYIQHEFDHLNGVLFVDRILAQKGKIYKIEKDEEGKEVFTEVKLI